MPDVTAHPSARALALFGQGKLSEAQAATVAAHLETCADCRRAMAGPPPPVTRTAGQTPAPSPAPAASAVPPELLRHPKFRVVRELGRGGMGVVYLAEHRVMNRPVAIKVISDDLLAAGDAAARLLTEVRAAARLDHQNIVRAFDAEHVGGLHLLIMEFVDGMSLAQLLEKKGPLSVTAACHCAGQAARGLQHAFERGMTHRDVKPHNLMLSPEGRVKILDFGIARVRSEQAGQTRSRLTRQDAFIGTPEYVAPEQAIDARQADTRSDIYSLGCTLYALLAGRPPFVGETAVQVVLAHVENRPRPLPERRPDVPPELWAVVAKMLAKDPARRYQTPSEAGRALAPFCKADSPPRHETACLSAAGIAPAEIVLDEGAGHVAPPPRRRSVAEPAADRPGPATEDEPPASPPAMSDHAWEAAAKRGKARLLLIAGGVVGAVVAGLALVVALTIGGKATPTPPESPLLVDRPPAPLPRDTRSKGHAPATGRDRGSISTEAGERDTRHESTQKLPPIVNAGTGKAPPPPPSDATLVLKVEPASARVVVNGTEPRKPLVDSGHGPEMKVAPGHVRVTIEKEGFEPEERQFDIAAGERKTLEIAMRAVATKGPEGTLGLALKPAGVVVLIDGNDAKLTVPADGKPVTIHLAEGKHQVKVSKPGYVDDTEDVTISQGKRTDRTVTLRLLAARILKGTRWEGQCKEIYIDPKTGSRTPKRAHSVWIDFKSRDGDAFTGEYWHRWDGGRRIERGVKIKGTVRKEDGRIVLAVTETESIKVPKDAEVPGGVGPLASLHERTFFLKDETIEEKHPAHKDPTMKYETKLKKKGP